MKVSIGYTVGSSLSIFLILCISMNAHLVNGQIVSIANATFTEDLSLLHVVVCFSNDSPTAGVVAIMTNPAVLDVNGQQGTSSTVVLSNTEVCHSQNIRLLISSQNIGTQLDITLASVVAVSVDSSIYPLQIPGPTLYFDGDMYSVEEGDSNDNINVMLDVCQTPITFSSTANVIISGGSAVAGRDYIQPTGSITIREQTSCTTLQIDIISDILAEETETIIVQLQPVSPSRLSATSGTTTVTITDDDNPITMNQPPTVQCPEDMFVTALSPSTITTAQFDAPECEDNEDNNFPATCTPSSGSSINLGSNIVTCTCTDIGGLTDSCTFVITVQMNQPPTVQCPADISVTVPPLSTSANVPFNTPQCLDNQQANFDATCTPPSGSLFNDGSRTVTCTCTDIGGLTDSCTFVITVQMNQPPTVQCPADISVTVPPLSTSANVPFNTPQCLDNQQANFDATCTPPSGSLFNDGSRTVTCTCTDIGGLTDSCTFVITVQKIGSTDTPATDTTSEISPSRATTTIPTTTTGMLATDTTQTMMTDVMTSTEPDLTPGMFTTDTTQTMTPASLTSRPDVTETTNMTGMFTTNTTQTMTTASPTSRPDATETTNMTEISTNTTPTMTPDPCQIQPCDGNATCPSNEGLVKCTCKDGFYGDGTINGTGCTGCPRNVPDEKFGLNCSSPCTCASNAECNSVTGDCFGVECGDSKPQTCDKNNLNVVILPDDMDVDEKTAFTLFCTVNLGTTDVTVTWTGPAGAEIQSGIFRGNLTSNLTVSNAGKEDSGTYTCIARLKKPTETVTSRNDSVNINVIDFPEIDNLRLQEKLSSSLKFIWTVKDKGNDNITCMANYSEVENNNKMSKICKETSCELSDLSPNTDYIISVVCNNTAGPSNTLNMTSKTLATVPEEVPDLNVADVNSTFITVTLKPVSTDNGPISCYEFVVAERSEVGTDADNDVPFSSVKENSDDGTPYRAVVMNHDEYTAQKTVIIGAEGNQSTCELPRNSRRKRASELVSSQTLTARNDPLTSANNYSIFLRVYVLSTDGKYTYSSSDYEHYQTKPTKEEPSSSGAALAVVLIILIIVIIGIVIAIFFVWRKRSKENYAEQDGEIIALGENGINDQTDSSPGINSGFEITVIQKLDPINIDELGNCILTKHQNSNRIFKQEFMSLLDVNKDATHEAFSHETNYQEKNRYINIFCYDHSRVKLEELEGVEQSDYINANYIDGYKQPNKFIAAQGPKTETLEDHWRMIWEQKTATIIMLARCFEDGGREKCAQYWPDEGSQKFGQFTVHLDSTAECSDYLIRKFRVTKEGEEEGTYRSINQFHYLAWPDHGVPEYPYTLLAFVKRIRQMTPPKPEKGNIIVHCSAGVGRTGTYITIDAMLDRLKEEKTVDIYNFVNSMRLNRRLLVQTEVQYTFIHHAMHEEHLYGHTEIPLADLHQYFRRLRLKTHIDDNSPLHNEFKTAATLPIRITKCIDASKEGNKEKNRTRNYLPYDHNRVLLERLVGDENSTYINASYIKGYERKNMYIATQAPMENTVHDFWRLVWESLTATVIMLTDLEEKGNEMCVKFWPEEEPQTFGNLTVELASENEEEDYTVHNFSLSSTEGVSGRKVTMFRFHGWPEVGTPNCCESVIDLVNVAHEHQQNSEREESPDHSRHPIVVFCHTGVGRTAVWIALSILMERARAEGVVDVFQTVRTLRQQRQHMLHDATQYEFLYQAVLKHLDTFDQYANYR